MIAGIAATPFDRLPRPPHRRTVVRRCGDYRPFSHKFSLSKVSPVTWRRVAIVRARVCGHDANHIAECATQGHNLRNLIEPVKLKRAMSRPDNSRTIRRRP